MHRKAWIIGASVLFALAACGDNNLERTASGAAIGGVAAAATGNSIAAGAAVGAVGGAICHDVNLC